MRLWRERCYGIIISCKEALDRTVAIEDDLTRILLVEDHASFRQTLAFMFEREPEFEVVAQAGSPRRARSPASR